MSTDAELARLAAAFANQTIIQAVQIVAHRNIEAHLSDARLINAQIVDWNPCDGRARLHALVVELMGKTVGICEEVKAFVDKIEEHLPPEGEPAAGGSLDVVIPATVDVNGAGR